MRTSRQTDKVSEIFSFSCSELQETLRKLWTCPFFRVSGVFRRRSSDTNPDGGKESIHRGCHVLPRHEFARWWRVSGFGLRHDCCWTARRDAFPVSGAGHTDSTAQPKTTPGGSVQQVRPISTSSATGCSRSCWQLHIQRSCASNWNINIISRYFKCF